MVWKLFSELTNSASRSPGTIVPHGLSLEALTAVFHTRITYFWHSTRGISRSRGEIFRCEGHPPGFLPQRISEWKQSVWKFAVAAAAGTISRFPTVSSHDFNPQQDSLRGSSVKIRTIQTRLAWPLCKDDFNLQHFNSRASVSRSRYSFSLQLALRRFKSPRVRARLPRLNSYNNLIVRTIVQTKIDNNSANNNLTD